MSAFTPLYETDADEIAPKLAQCSGVASAVFFWLFSRSYACKNEVRVSQGWLAETLGINKRTMARAVRQLQDLGLVEVSGKRGRGGGSVFSIASARSLNTSQAPYLERNNESVTNDRLKGVNTTTQSYGGPVNTTPLSYDKEEELKEDKPSFSPNDETAPVLSRLNELTGKAFGASDAQPIRAAMQSGLGVGECIRAVEHCCASFSDEYRAYLTPRTIFKPAKARGYARAWREGDGAAAERRRESESFDWSIYD